jgi:Rieske Fe-S protein
MTESSSPQSGSGPEITRRSFGKSIAGGIAVVLAGGLYALRRWYHSQATPPRIIAQTNDVPVGGSKIFQYPTDTAPCILVRTGEASYVAYSRICTHNSCPVFYRPDENAFECRCHNGLFSVADGSVLQGPPPRPLPRILLEIRDHDILAIGIANT